MSRRIRFGLLATGVFVFLAYFFMSFGHDTPVATSGVPGGELAEKSTESLSSAEPFGGAISGLGLPESILTGGAIAPKLGNETAKRELGRASWRLMHTMMARFPDKPTTDDSLALQTYIQLFARLYPCGECAQHFQKLLNKYPPQTSSRNAAAGWACFVHNEVNKRLKKTLFDCSKIGDFYDCGCAEDDTDGKDGKSNAAASSKTSVEDDSGDEVAIKLEKEEG